MTSQREGIWYIKGSQQNVFPISRAVTEETCNYPTCKVVCLQVKVTNNTCSMKHLEAPDSDRGKMNLSQKRKDRNAAPPPPPPHPHPPQFK